MLGPVIGDMLGAVTNSYRYAERVTPSQGDPLDVVTSLVSSGVFDEYLVMERDGRFRVAGDALADIRAGSTGLRVTMDGESSVVPGDGSLRQVAAALHDLPVAGWHAYGWVAFESGRPAIGLPVEEQPLVHVIVPRYEVVVDRHRMVVRGVDEAGTTRIADLLAGLGPARDEGAEPVSVDVSHDGDRYRAVVAAAVAEIRSGVLQKVIVSRTVPVELDVDMVRTYACGRRANTPARSFLLDLGGLRAAGFSPEIVCESDGVTAATQPLAGTRAMHSDPAATGRMRAELQSDPKEIFEHAVSVKAAVDELGDVCRPGTVRVEGLLTVQERGSVQHLGSTVRGEVGAGRDAWDVLQAVFPAVTASGIPKPAAYDAIRRLESQPRGLYAGAVLFADERGALDAALVLRTVFQSEGRTWLRAGAGIVSASTPDREYEETCEKLRSVSRFLVPRAGRTSEGVLASSATGGAT